MTPRNVEALEALDLASLLGQSFVETADASLAQLEAICGLAEAFEALDKQRKVPRLLAGELAYALFFDNSTRTRSAWAGAAARLGMAPVIVDGSSTQVEHGETAEETGAMLGMNAHALGIRHDKFLGEGNPFIRSLKRGIDEYLQATDDARAVPVVNLQCDVDHPTQALADLLWLRERFGGDLRGRRITVSWAYSPSYAKPLSVPQGLISLLPRFGAQVTLAHPPGYELRDSSFAVEHDMAAAFADADVVYPKSWGPRALMEERVVARNDSDDDALRDIERRALAQNAEHQDWICDQDKMARTRDAAALYMHCLPADLGDEVTRKVYDRYRVLVARQANKKLYAIMALLAGAKVEGLATRLMQGGAS
jgi:knotted carbamoyltransferase YgeW